MGVKEFNRLIALGMLRLENGSITLSNRKVAFMPIGVILHLHSSLSEKYGAEVADGIMFEAGRFQTASGSEKYMKNKENLGKLYNQLPRTGHPSLEMAREVLMFAGWGDHRSEHVAPDGSGLVIRTYNSPLADEYLATVGKSSKPVCHYLRGLLAGSAEGAFKSEYEVEETSCKATGLCAECVFRLSKKKAGKGAKP
ncbi:MAG: 4-vinyl reductase [Candidatus Micrarchaeia archaeon]